MKLFFDNCIAIGIAQAIARLAQTQRISVEHLQDRFPPGTPDPEWIRALQGEDIVIVSGDTRIAKNPINCAAWKESQLTAFFLDEDWARAKFWTQAAELVRWCPVIIDTAKRGRRGAGYRLPIKGSKPKLFYEPEQ